MLASGRLPLTTSSARLTLANRLRQKIRRRVAGPLRVAGSVGLIWVRVRDRVIARVIARVRVRVGSRVGFRVRVRVRVRVRARVGLEPALLAEHKGRSEQGHLVRVRARIRVRI